MTVYETAKVYFAAQTDHPDDDGYATVYDEVELLSSGWVRCGSGPFGPQLFPPHRIEEVDVGYAR